MGTTTSLQLPSGTGDSAFSDGSDQNQRPVNKRAGMIRYNETTTEVEVYQGGTWRALRYKEATGIVQQTLGFGNNVATFFGPLAPEPTVGAAGTTWDSVQFAKQLLVIVENVIQLSATNYTLIQNPTIPGETYTPKTAGTTTVGSTVINIDPTLVGFIAYPAVDITGAAVTGANIAANTVIESYTINVAGQLTQIVLNNPTVSSNIAAGTMLTISDSTNTVSDGWYLQFSSPVPHGKPVVVLHGFDR